jgi:predicted transcriptional regulator
MTLTLTPSTEKRLAEKANREGVDPSQLADRILNAGLDWAELPEMDEAAEIEEGLRACEEGRVRPFEEFASEHQARFGSGRK